MTLDDVQLHLVETLDDALALNDWFLRGPQQHGKIAVDTETTGLSPEQDFVRTVQVGDMTAGWCLPWEGWSGLFTDIMSRFNGNQIQMHNAPFDFAFINKMGHRLPRHLITDSRVMAHILEPNLPTALKKQASRHVDPAAGAPQKELDEAITRLGWGGVPIKFGPFWQYAALDPVLTAYLTDILSQRLTTWDGWKAFEVENSVQWVLEQMMRRGLQVDVSYAKEQQVKFLDYCEKAEKWCRDQYGVSPGSNAAVVGVLQKAGYEFTKSTAAGAVALDKEVLGGIDHPLAQTVLKRRQLQKLATTYLDHYIHGSIGGLVHPSINSKGARTSRMSVSSPNMQNLPRVTEGNPAANIVRNCITARAGHTLVFCDFAQVETRLLAHLSKDPGLISAFHSPDDFFVTLARTIFRDDTITKKSPQRNVIKTWVYATIYGAGVEKQAQSAGVSVREMVAINATIQRSYPGIKKFQDHVATTVATNRRNTGEGFIICPLSGRRHVTDKGQDYAAVNYLIQGMAAFFFKMKLLELDAAGLGEWMILPVHDEIILDVPNEEVDNVCRVLTKVMNDREAFSVPIEAEVSIGPRWGEKRAWTLTA
jgi:DNA polymerase-1